MPLPNETLMHLQYSESVVAQMAATILVGLSQLPEFNLATEDQLIERSASLAIKLAVRVDKLVKSDEEWLKKTPTSVSPHG
jgi:hypothetical protein